jgi:hypothetical protein
MVILAYYIKQNLAGLNLGSFQLSPDHAYSGLLGLALDKNHGASGCSCLTRFMFLVLIPVLILVPPTPCFLSQYQQLYTDWFRIFLMAAY